MITFNLGKIGNSVGGSGSAVPYPGLSPAFCGVAVETDKASHGHCLCECEGNTETHTDIQDVLLGRISKPLRHTLIVH